MATEKSQMILVTLASRRRDGLHDSAVGCVRPLHGADWLRGVTERLDQAPRCTRYLCLVEDSVRNQVARSTTGAWVMNHDGQAQAVVWQGPDGTLVVLRRGLWNEIWRHLPQGGIEAVVACLERLGTSVVWLPPRQRASLQVGGALRRALRAVPGAARLRGMLFGQQKSLRAAVQPTRWPNSTEGDRRTGLLFIVPWLEMGGADKVNLDLLRGLPKERYRKIVVTTLMNAHPWEDAFAEVTDEVYHLPYFSLGPEESVDFLAYLTECRGVDLIQISNSWDGYRLLRALRPHVVRPTLSLVHTYVPEDPWDFARLSLGYQDIVDFNVAVSETLRKQMMNLGFSAGKIRTIVNGVDTKVFKPGSGGNEERTVLFVGRMVEQKNPMAFVHMALRLMERSDMNDVHFVMVGDGPLLPQVKDAVASAGAARRVALLGAGGEAEVRTQLQQATVLAMPSRWEGLPIIGLEALACGLPIVATRVDGWTELIQNDVGILVEESVSALAEGVYTLLSDGIMRRRFSEQARAKAERYYSAPSMAAAYENLYSLMLHKVET